MGAGAAQLTDMKAILSRTILVGDTAHVFLGAEGDSFAKADELIARTLAAGNSVKEGGVTRWVETVAVHVAGGTGSGCFIWDRRGNRVKHTRTEVTKHADGTVTRSAPRFVFLAP